MRFFMFSYNLECFRNLQDTHSTTLYPFPLGKQYPIFYYITALKNFQTFVLVATYLNLRKAFLHAGKTGVWLVAGQLEKKI